MLYSSTKNKHFFQEKKDLLELENLPYTQICF